MNSVTSNNFSLKYQRFTWSGCKDIKYRKFEFVAKAISMRMSAPKCHSTHKGLKNTVVNYCWHTFELTCSMLSRPVQSNLNPAPGPLVPLAPTSSRTLELNISLEHVLCETNVFNKNDTFYLGDFLIFWVRIFSFYFFSLSFYIFWLVFWEQDSNWLLASI